MLLRSSSAPVIGTLPQLHPISDASHNDFESTNEHTAKNSLSPDNHACNISFSHGGHRPQLLSFSLSSPPLSHSALSAEKLGVKPFRRALSDGNLEGLGVSPIDVEGSIQNPNPSSLTLSSCSHNNSMLHTAPSFSVFNSVESEEHENQEEEQNPEALERSVTTGDSIESKDSGFDFSFVRNDMGLIEEGVEEENDDGLNSIKNLGLEDEARPASPPLYLATGLGIEASGFDAISDQGIHFLAPADFKESSDAEEYYRRMINEYPSHPLILRNYAQLLQSKGDLPEAEKHCLLATMADPGDGEILCQYAKLVWELHHDQQKAMIYFERAAQVAPQDSHVLAAYASFLWEIDDDEGNAGVTDYNNLALKEVELPGFDKDINESGSEKYESIEEYYKKMVMENSSNPLFLRNYAQFLYQSKGDLKGAEEYYSRAILANEGDGEILAEYAKLIWELHHDHDRALGYFERAVQADPGDSTVLAAYASFLWETQEEDDDVGPDQFQQPHLQTGAIAASTA